MRQLLACTVCFNTNVKLIHLDYQGLRPTYHLVSGLKTSKQNGMPQYLCVECSAIIRKFKKFRDKCQRAYYTLQQIQTKKEISLSDIQSIDKTAINISPCLSFMEPSRCHYEESKFKWVKINRISIIDANVPVFTCSTFEDHKFIIPKDKGAKEEDDSKTTAVKVEDAEELADVLEHLDDFQEEKTEQIEISIDDANIQELGASDDNNDNENDNFEDNEINDYPSDEEELPQDAAKDDADGCSLDKEYATMVELTKPEIFAVLEITKLNRKGSKVECKVCGRGFLSQERLQIHSRMHDVHTSGLFQCEFCLSRYKTDFLLKTHLTEKHLYKYLCKKCPEVTFDRRAAKQHFLMFHMVKRRDDDNWEENRPKWLSTKGGHRNRGVVFVKPKKKLSKLPEDFLKLVPIEHNEQYTLIQERKKSRNYVEAPFKCEFCFRGFRVTSTYNTHMKKHNPAISGKYQCDMCKLYLPHPRKMYKHMTSMHLYKYCCQSCDYICYNRNQAHSHYRWHNNVMYKCPHCPKEFKKISTRLTHIRIKHPSNCICNLCGHSFVSATGLNFHQRFAHKDEVGKNPLKVNKDDPLYCADCNIMFVDDMAYTTHLGSSSKHATINKSVQSRGLEYKRRAPGRPRGRPPSVNTHIVNTGEITSTNCEYCGEELTNDVQARKHYQTAHPGKDFLKRYMCDVCGHTTRQYANLLVHMRTHTREKPYACPHCDRTFSMPSNRDRHIVVHTREKKFACPQCDRRFTQKTAIKIHVQTVHLKIPYLPWDKKYRKRRKELLLQGLAAGPSNAAENMQSQSDVPSAMDNDNKMIDHHFMNMNYNMGMGGMNNM